MFTLLLSLFTVFFTVFTLFFREFTLPFTVFNDVLQRVVVHSLLCAVFTVFVADYLCSLL